MTVPYADRHVPMPAVWGTARGEGSADRCRPAAALEDIAEACEPRADATVMRADRDEVSLVSVELPGRDPDFSFLEQIRLDDRMSHHTIDHHDGQRIVQRGVRWSAHRQGKPGCTSRRDCIATQVADALPALIVHVHGQQQRRRLRPHLEEQLFLPLELDHSIRGPKHIGADV